MTTQNKINHKNQPFSMCFTSIYLKHIIFYYRQFGNVITSKIQGMIIGKLNKIVQGENFIRSIDLFTYEFIVRFSYSNINPFSWVGG